MTTLKRYKYHLLAILILGAMMMMGVKTRVSDLNQTAEELPKVQTGGQLDHALELFKKEQYPLVIPMDAQTDLRPYILNSIKRSLPMKFQPRAFEIARAVINEANHHRMDPLFLLAVIKTESKFDLKAVGSHGEIGLMQILPSTANWMAAQAGLSTQNLNLEDPAVNIRIGTTYFAQLRKNFNGFGSRYVAAYNMGSTNVRRLLASNTEPYIYPGKVLKNYERFYTILDRLNEDTSRHIASVE